MGVRAAMVGQERIALSQPRPSFLPVESRHEPDRRRHRTSCRKGSNLT
jgi:hypothetical protein